MKYLLHRLYVPPQRNYSYKKSRKKTMQEEVTQKTIALVFKSSRLTADVLKKAMKMYLQHWKVGKQTTHGKMSVKKLVGQGMGASSIEVTDNNIKSFERVARKYNVDFAVKKDKTVEPPKYMVFFKGKDADVITQAFKEFVKVNEKKRGRVSVKEKLAEFRELLGKSKRTPERQGAVAMSKIIDGIVNDLKAIPETLKAKTAGVDNKKLILMNLPYILAGYFCDKIAWLWRVSPGSNASDKMMAAMNGLNDLFSNPLPSFSPKDLLIGIVGGVALRLVVYYKAKNAKKFRQGVEYGSARWGNAKDIEPYVDLVFENNVILTETERLMMSGRPKQPKYARNKNILVIGGSGSGKTRFFVKPNLMQMHNSYVVTDPKGTVLVECGKMLLKNGYKVKVLNTINFKNQCITILSLISGVKRTF